jgi:hypothetical protein
MLNTLRGIIAKLFLKLFLVVVVTCSHEEEENKEKI